MKLQFYLLLSIITTNSILAQKDTLTSIYKPKDFLLYVAGGSTYWSYPYEIGLDYFLSKKVSVGYLYVNIVRDDVWTDVVPQDYANGHFLKVGSHIFTQPFFARKYKNDSSTGLLGGLLNWHYSETSMNRYPNYSVGIYADDIFFIKDNFGIYLAFAYGWHFQGGPVLNYQDYSVGVVFKP